MSERCTHESFQAQVDVNRLSAVEGGRVTGYNADIRIKCAQCGLAFRFLGLKAGSHYAEPRVSVDAEELRAPIEPVYVTEILGMPAISGSA